MSYSLYLTHHGIKGMHWGVRNGPPYPLSNKRVFISGTSKLNLKDNPYYRGKLPDRVANEIDLLVSSKARVHVGDAPGVDSSVQDYLASKKYHNVTVYTVETGKPRYMPKDADALGWKVKNVKSNYEPGSKEFLRDKDIAMTNDSTHGLSVILENGGAGATRRNIERLLKQNKNVNIFELRSSRDDDDWISIDEFIKEQMKH